MTDAEKGLAWLDKEIASYKSCNARDDHPTLVALRAIKALLAEPRLLKEPSFEILGVMCTPVFGRLNTQEWIKVYSALYAHLTAPKTKIVEVWDCRWVFNGEPKATPHRSREDAEADARTLRAHPHNEDGRWSCIHVTGPHKQEVPA